jgi:xylose isomerase
MSTMLDFFHGLAPVRFEGPETDNEFAFRHYDRDEVVLGKRMEDHLRFSVAWWHPFAWPGAIPFGGQTFERPGSATHGGRAQGRLAFEMFRILARLLLLARPRHPARGDFASRGRSRRSSTTSRARWRDGRQVPVGHGQHVHASPLDGGARPTRPRVFLYAAATVKAAGRTHRWGENYVLWGGREGYETLLNTDLKREREQAGRFRRMVVD